VKKDILELIKKTGSIRHFKKTRISDRLVDTILEAGVWGPSIFGIQPWHFVVVKNPLLIKKIASIVDRNSHKTIGGVRKLLQMCSAVIKNCKLLIAVCVNGSAKKTASRYGVLYKKKAAIAELLASGAAIQNMFLTLTSLGLGGVWLDAPTIFPYEINNILDEKDNIVSLLAIGYPNQSVRRSIRNYNTLVKFI